jgi:hypothetical protein
VSFMLTLEDQAELHTVPHTVTTLVSYADCKDPCGLYTHNKELTSSPVATL